MTSLPPEADQLSQIKEKIIPAFEELHSPSEYQALFLIDNSQGHSAYSADALLVSRMNLGPGGAKPCMRDGWYMRDGQKITQSMVFPQDHPTNPGQPKGMKEVLRERGMWRNGLLLLCRNAKCSIEATSCCATRIMSLQPDFQAQRSLVQETIEAAGHLCIFLPKFHCELNFIEFFWGAVKKYLREHCDYSYSGLQENIPKALESVNLSTIRKWEHRMIRWMDAYRGGKTGKEAQKQVKQFSSRRYDSHRRVPETVARAFD